MRRTQNLTQALERLAPWVNDISVTEAEERGRWVITTPTDPWGLGPTSKRTKNNSNRQRSCVNGSDS